jgi:hypothetical protein
LIYFESITYHKFKPWQIVEDEAEEAAVVEVVTEEVTEEVEVVEEDEEAVVIEEDFVVVEAEEVVGEELQLLFKSSGEWKLMATRVCVY